MKNTIQEANPFPFKRLLAVIPDPEVLARAQEVGEKLKASLYLVGGPVRDFLLGRPVKDLDLVVEGDPELVAQELAQALSGKVKARSQFYTFKILYPGGELDLAMARKELYPSPAALPRVEPADIHQDLFRRDFTINAMAVGLTGPYREKFLDPFQGLEDLSRGWVRVLHLASFVDDPTRIFRAARYAVRFDFRLAPQTSQALGRAYRAETPGQLSAARIRNEFMRILEEPSPKKVLQCLEEMGLFMSLRLPAPPDLPEDLPGGVTKEEYLKALLLALGEGQPQELVRLGLSPEEAERFGKTYPEALKTLESLPSLERPSQRYTRLKGLPRVVLLALFLRYESFRPLVRDFFRAEKIRPELTGEDLKRLLGLPPGPKMGEILRYLREARIDGEVKTREEELALARKLLWANPSSSGKV